MWERRQNRRNRPQLLAFALIANRNFMVGGLMALVFFSTLPGFFLCLAIFLQVGFGFDPLKSGLTTIPFSVGVFVASVANGRFGSVALKFRMMCGLVLLLTGIFWLRFYVLTITDTISHWAVFGPLLTAGLGLGMSIASIFQLVLAGVPAREAGSASGALQAVQQLGGAFGIAIISEIFFSTLANLLKAGSGQHPAYVEAFAGAVVFNLAAYVVVAVLVTMLPAHKGIRGPGKAEPHIA